MTDHITDTNKKVEPMSMDELICEISTMQLLDKIETLEELTDAIIELVDRHRPAFEAGMRGMLRFHGKQNFQIINPKFRPDCTILQPWFTREEASIFAQFLGMTAEFVEATDE